MHSLRRIIQRYWRQILLLLTSTLVSLALGEAAIRIVIHWKHHRRLAAFTHELWLPQPGRPEEIFSLRPNVQGVAYMPRKEENAWRYATNRDGFRGRPLTPKRPGTVRILCLGDSYTFGWGVDENEEPYPRIIERVLNQDAGTTRVEALNLGIPGYNTRMENALLQRIAGQYEPDIVVAAYVMNDTEPPGYEVPVPPQVRYRYCHSWLMAQVVKTVNQWLGREAFATHENVYDVNYMNAFTINRRKSLEVREALESMSRFCRERNIRLDLCILPDFSKDMNATYRWRAIHQQIGEWARELAIPAIDLFAEFEGRPGEEYQLEGDWHPNAQAHRRIGERLARHLQELKFIAAPNKGGESAS